MDTLADRVKWVVESVAKVKPVKFADVVGVSRASVSKWLNGTTKSIDAENAFKIEDRYQVSARWIATGKGNRFTNKPAGGDAACGDAINRAIETMEKLSPEAQAAVANMLSEIIQHKGPDEVQDRKKIVGEN
jgi:transcriptional regulator with XRE-family HTH domain